MSRPHNGGLAPRDQFEVIAPLAHEAKAITLGAMQPKRRYYDDDLSNHVMLLQGSEPVWEITEWLSRRHVASFIPSGMVRRRANGNGNEYDQITPLTADLVQPYIGHILTLSLNQKPSLAKFFGPMYTNSPTGIRPCERRIGIMRFVAQGTQDKPARISDVAELLGVKVGAAGDMVDTLAASGILNVKTTGKGNSTIEYRDNGRLADMVIKPQSARQVYLDTLDVMRAKIAESPSTSFTNYDLAIALHGTGRYDVSLSELVDTVASITYRLSIERGVLDQKRVSGNPKSRTVVWADDAQTKVISSLLEAVDGLAHPTEDYLHHGRRKLNAIFKKPSLVRELILKAKTDSVALKAFNEAQHRADSTIDEIIAETPEPLSVREIHGVLESRGVDISLATVRRHIKILQAKGGGISSKPTNAGTKYFKP